MHKPKHNLNALGALDISGILNQPGQPGRRIELEAKAPGGKLTPKQAKTIEFWEKYGAITGKFENIDELEEIMAPYLN